MSFWVIFACWGCLQIHSRPLNNIYLKDLVIKRITIDIQGQNIMTNWGASAIQVTHVPTGLTRVSSQYVSQHMNRNKAILELSKALTEINNL